MKKLIVLLLMVAFILPSCFPTRTYVGSYYEDTRVKGYESYKFAKKKQAFFFLGLIPLGRTQVPMPEHGSCEIKARFGLLDLFISAITAGLITTRTIKVTAAKVVEEAPAQPAEPVVETPAQPQTQTQQPATTENSELDALRQLL